MSQRTIEPFRHLHFPVGYARQLIPAARPMHATRNTNNLAGRPNLPQRRIKIGRFAERNILILISENLQKRRIPLCAQVMGDASFSASASPFSLMSGSSKACTSALSGTVAKLLCANNVTTACTCAGSRSTGSPPKVLPANSTALPYCSETRPPSRRPAQYDSALHPNGRIMADKTNRPLDVVDHVGVGILRRQAIVDGEYRITCRSQKVAQYASLPLLLFPRW